jgi:8-oxo-dGTP pyrophosphatase MutT (NUDIX family)
MAARPPRARRGLTLAHRRPLLDLLAGYAVRHPEEGACVARVRALVESRPDCFERGCRPGHVTGSAWVLSADRRRFLLTHHRKLGRWLQLGGHADGETDAAAVALREAAEESRLAPLAFLGPMASGAPLPIDLDVHEIPERPGEPAHEHHDVRFALVARGGEARAGAESHELRWFEMADLDAVLAELGADASLVRLGRKARDLLASAAGPTASRA